jgi:hypothetical protein
VTGEDLDLPRRVDKPWGHELIWAHTDRYVGKLLVIEAGRRLSLQRHLVKDESILVTGGRLRLTLEDDAGRPGRGAGAGDARRVATGRSTARRSSAGARQCHLGWTMWSGSRTTSPRGHGTPDPVGCALDGTDRDFDGTRPGRPPTGSPGRFGDDRDGYRV